MRPMPWKELVLLREMHDHLLAHTPGTPVRQYMYVAPSPPYLFLLNWERHISNQRLNEKTVDR